MSLTKQEASYAMTINIKVLELMADGRERTKVDVARNLGVNENVARNAMRRLKITGNLSVATVKSTALYSLSGVAA